MEDYVEFNLKLRRDTYEDILQIVGYNNIDNLINEKGELPSDYTVTDFITGCINTYISEIKSLANLSNYGELNSHHPIKNRFKEYIDQLDMSQRDFCKKVGIHQSGLSNIINNQKQPSLDTFIRIWLGLGCPRISDILYRED